MNNKDLETVVKIVAATERTPSADPVQQANACRDVFRRLTQLFAQNEEHVVHLRRIYLDESGQQPHHIEA